MSVKMLTWEEAVQWLKSQPDRQELVKACYYDDPLLEAAQRFVNSEEWQAVYDIAKGWIKGRVLDLGAGNGISSYAFAITGCQVTALEPNPSNIVGAGAICNLAKISGLDIAVVKDWGETLPFADRTFDIVYGRAVLHHAHDLNLLCKEAARVLKPNGYFIATREHVISQQADLQKFLDGHPLHHLYGGENAYLLEEYVTAISSSGLQIVQTLDPLQSVINYSPMTKLERKNLLELFLTKKLGYKIASRISKIKFLEKSYIWYISAKSNIPGRLYSFIAVKP